VLKVRLIPTLTLRGERLVKTCRFGPTRDVGDPVKAPMVYDAQLADELVFLDMDATREHRGVDRLEAAVGRLAGSCFMPLTAGGGIRTVDDVRRLIAAGADKVSVNTAAVERPALIREVAQRFGAQCVVVAMDARRVNGGYEVFTAGGTRAAGIDPVTWAKRAVELGAGELLVTSIDREGTMTGYDLDLIRSVATAVDVPVIASGGAGSFLDLVLAIREGRASAAAAASLFHFTDQSPIKAKAFMKREGLPVR
jgi:cyclase